MFNVHGASPSVLGCSVAGVASASPVVSSFLGVCENVVREIWKSSDQGNKEQDRTGQSGTGQDRTGRNTVKQTQYTTNHTSTLLTSTKIEKYMSHIEK